MRRPVRALLAAAIFSGLVATGCSSSSRSSTTAASGEDFCTLLVAFRATNSAFAAQTGDPSPDAYKTAITKLVSQVSLLQQEAPAVLRPDVDVVAGYLGSLDTLFAKYGYDVDAIGQDTSATDAFTALTTDEVESSQLQLVTYAEQSCGTAGGSTTVTVPAPIAT